MAGFSYDLTRKLALDLNYRYLNLGDTVSGHTTINNQHIHYDDITAHEIRVGLRYMIN